LEVSCGHFLEAPFHKQPQKEESDCWAKQDRIEKDNLKILLNTLTVKEEFYQEKSCWETYLLLICD
jgi:hypothetical protein